MKQTNKQIRSCLFRACWSKESQPPSLAFGGNSKAGKGGGIFIIKKKDFRYALIGDCWHGEGEGRLTTSGASHMIVWGTHLAFSSWSQVGSRHKNKKTSSQCLMSALSGFDVAGVDVWFSELISVEFVTQSSIVIHELSTLHLYN